jgi:hypothetical protein
MSEPHARFGRPLSAKYVNLHLNLLHSIYKTAIGEELVQVNPVVGVERPKVQRRRWRILQPDEVGPVAAGFTDERARRVFLTLMLTGLRQFELQALRWQDVNLLEGTLRVVESKSEEGERLVALPCMLLGELEGHYSGSAYRAGSDYVFAHPRRGTRLEEEWYAGEFRAALAAAGITDYIRPFHDARHAALTNLAATGASPSLSWRPRGTARCRRRSSTFTWLGSCSATTRRRSRRGCSERPRPRCVGTGPRSAPSQGRGSWRKRRVWRTCHPRYKVRVQTARIRLGYAEMPRASACSGRSRPSRSPSRA